ncbi:MAG: NAD-dependent deacylase [Acidobacteria bacterium]|nr:NAD-dependent deacylase [Acidobacteriota bacterium]
MEIPAALIERLEGARRVSALTGAGVSSESGVPTFRGPKGLWKQFRPEELATPEAFQRDPRLVWEWYEWRRSKIASCSPNAAHRVLADWERRFEEFWLVTQNVDGLHDRAGSRNLVKLHGDLWELRCAGCGVRERNEAVPLPAIPPRCHCGNLLRPAVVWFGESLPEAAWRRAVEVARSCQLFFVVGTSALVQPAASLPWVAREAGACVVEVNPDSTPFTPFADVSLRGPAAVVLPALDQVICQVGQRDEESS